MPDDMEREEYGYDERTAAETARDAAPRRRGAPAGSRKNKINTGMPDKLQYSKSSTHTHIFP